MQFQIDVPATLANLGAGYDTLGLAVALRNRFVFAPGPPDPGDLVWRTARDAARRFGQPAPAFRCVQYEQIPRTRGMGSSATARVAGLLAFQHLCGHPLPLEQQAAFLTEAEGHPDNVWPALLGGLVLCGAQPVPLGVAPTLRVAVAAPARALPTAEARRVLPDLVRHADAVHTLNAACQLVVGLQRGDLTLLRAGVDDRLHQPHRGPLIGPVAACFEAARALGAAPFIGGSGSTVAAFVGPGGDPAQVADAMARPLRATGQAVQCLALPITTTGATVSAAG